MSKFEGAEDRAEWPPEEKPDKGRFDLGIRDGYGICEMSLVEVDGGIRLTLSEGRDFVGKTLTPDMAKRVGTWLLDHAGQGHKQDEETRATSTSRSTNPTIHKASPGTPDSPCTSQPTNSHIS